MSNRIRTENANCSLCQSDTNRVYLKVDDWTLVSCRKCGMIFLNPRPAVGELPKLYVSEYFNRRISSRSTGLPRDRQGIESRICSQTLRVRLVGKHMSPPGHLLDIGCGPGFFMARAACEGWDVHGIDISQWAVDYAKEYLGLAVQVGSPDEIANLWHDDFDVITMFHLLEHLPNPLRALQVIRGTLRNKGVIVITVPNIGGFEARYYGRDWDGLRIPYHLSHYTPGTICQMLDDAGFEVITVYKQPSQLVTNWIKKLMGMGSSQENKGKQNKIDGTSSSVPQISTAHKIYAVTLGRLFPGRTMTAIARKKVQ